MAFAHDTELALVAAAALVNSDLPDLAALDEFFTAYNWTGRREHTAAELRSVQELRPRLRRLWTAGEDEVVRIVNTLLRESNALPQLVRHDGSPYHLHATSQDAPLAARMGVEAAMAFVDVVRSGELSRLRICDYPGCGNVVVVLDMSKSMNHILELDPGRKIARVQPGVILDDLRRQAEEHHLTFAPDHSTHNHCCLGGMFGKKKTP